MKLKKSGIFIIIILLVAFLGLNSIFTVRENEYACTVRFAKIIDTTGQSGLHFKIPFIDSVKYFPKATQLYDIPPSEVLTSDKQNMTVDCYILWSISDPKLFYQTLTTTANAEQRLDALTYNQLKTVMGTLAQSDIINMEEGAKRNNIYEKISNDVDALARTYGIHVEDVKIKQFDLPESNLNAVYNRMISERNQMAEKYTADGNYEASIIRNDVDKQVNIMVSDAEAEAAKLEAEGEAEYMRMLAEAYDNKDKQEFYEFTLALDALKDSLTGDQKTVILDGNSELAKILMGAN
ncbi:MAG: protease modulator HflC [Oscillospiraceae bacterium]|nr:protease modulator HflC [Oscillospiraceae bacterium]